VIVADALNDDWNAIDAGAPSALGRHAFAAEVRDA
jgi:hypothetical protein